MKNDSYINNMLALLNCLKSAGIILLAAFLFFDSMWGIVVLLPYGLFSIYKVAKRMGERQKNLVVDQFKDLLGCILTSMEAGISIERALGLAVQDLAVMQGEKSYMVTKLRQMNRRLELSENVEDIMLGFASERGIKEIENFAEILYVAKRTGGDIISLIRSATTDLYEKIEVRREIEGIIASARMECSVMKFMPLAILLYLRVFSFDLLAPLYESLLGRILMLIVSGIYFGLMEYSDSLVERALE